MSIQNLPGGTWSAGEAAAINDFLNQPLGRKWLNILMARKPRLDLTTTEKAALTGAYAAGYEHFFIEIISTRASASSADMGAKGIDPTKD